MNKRQFLTLWESFRQKKQFPNGLLVTGPPHLISDAHSLWMPMLCHHPKEAGTVGCGTCRACVQHQVEQSSDHWFLKAAEGHNKVPLDDIRQMQKAVLLKQDAPSDLPFFVVVPDVSHVSQSGWNILLKTLEEPPDQVSFLLFGALSHALPMTIRSRLLKVYVYEGDKDRMHHSGKPFELSLMSFRSYLQLQKPSLLEDWRSYAAACFQAMSKSERSNETVKLAGAFLEFSDVLSRKQLDGSINIKYAFTNIISRYESL